MPLTTPSVFPPASDAFAKFASRRSVVHSTKGIVACSQSLAAKCGIEILDAGGNCVVSVRYYTVSYIYRYEREQEQG